MVCNTYSTVGRSIASIYDQGAYIFTEARSAKVNMSAEVHLPNSHLVLYMHLNIGVKPRYAVGA